MASCNSERSTTFDYRYCSSVEALDLGSFGEVNLLHKAFHDMFCGVNGSSKKYLNEYSLEKASF